LQPTQQPVHEPPPEQLVASQLTEQPAEQLEHEPAPEHLALLEVAEQLEQVEQPVQLAAQHPVEFTPDSKRELKLSKTSATLATFVGLWK